MRPETDLARAAGLELGARGGIRVDGHMRTSDPAIYAVGERRPVGVGRGGGDVKWRDVRGRRQGSCALLMLPALHILLTLPF